VVSPVVGSVAAALALASVVAPSVSAALSAVQAGSRVRRRGTIVGRMGKAPGAGWREN
jgi:hypothetical protein